MIEIIPHNHASELISLSENYLEQNESENNLPIGLAYRLAEDPHYYGPELPLLLSILKQGKVVGVVLMTPPHRIILSRISTEVQTAIVHLIHHLREIGVQIPGVVGPVSEAQTFADCWLEDLCCVSSKTAMRTRVFEARKTADIPLSPGKFRLARMDDHLRMAHWIVAFSGEIGEPADLDSVKKRAEQHIKAGQLYIWEDDAPVSIAAAARPTRNGISVTKVYTPPEHRNKGYATSCVWSLTQKMLADGYSFCSLYTDLSNPTSNSIYAKIGYVSVGDALAVDFQSNRVGSKRENDKTETIRDIYASRIKNCDA